MFVNDFALFVVSQIADNGLFFPGSQFTKIGWETAGAASAGIAACFLRTLRRRSFSDETSDGTVSKL
ncbi:MAG TPA: hypothetical protein VGI63_04580 [Verrucomicrobiae bacterium]